MGIKKSRCDLYSAGAAFAVVVPPRRFRVVYEHRGEVWCTVGEEPGGVDVNDKVQLCRIPKGAVVRSFEWE